MDIINNEKVYINGEEYKELYVKGTTFENGMKFQIIIPDNKYFFRRNYSFLGITIVL